MKRSPINRESASKAAGREQRRRLVKALQDAGLWECQIGPVLTGTMLTQSAERSEYEVRRITDGVLACQHEPSGLHERRKRSSQGSLTVLANLVPACSPCNGWVEDHPEIAHSLGLVVRPGDNDWFLCGEGRDGF